jgi:hypothetical protein
MRKSSTDREEETTLERYQRKEREKKAVREAVRAEGSLGDKKAEGKAKEEDDVFFAIEDSDNDKFDVPSNGKEGQKDKGKDKVPTTTERGEEATEAALALLLGTPAGVKHFDMGDRKNKQGQVTVQDGKDVEDDFELDTHDPQFNILLEDHNFVINPSNPQYVDCLFSCRGADRWLTLVSRRRRVFRSVIGKGIQGSVRGGSPKFRRE